jgi:hypothetical protein
MDVATGLLYVGNGQYYDPATGRFLTRNVNPDSTNPYVPWNPIGAIVGPLGLLSMFYSRKRKRGKLDTLVILVLLGISMGIGIVACAPPPPVTPAPTNPSPAETPVSTGPITIPSDLPTSTPSPVVIPTATPCATPTTFAPNLDYDILDWGRDDNLDESWRVLRSQWVWDWLEERGGFWGPGHPDVKTLVTILLVGEGVSLMNVNSSGKRLDGLHVMVWYMRSLFDGGDGITATDLSAFTAFFNPKRDASGAWTQEDRDAYQKGPGDYTLKISRDFVDAYWDAGPVSHNGNIVYKWWDNSENFSYTTAFSVNIPFEYVVINGKKVPKILFFGY